MDSVGIEVEKLQKKQKTFHKSTVDRLNNLLNALKSLKSSPSSPASSTTALYQKAVTSTNSDIQSVIKDYYMSLGKVSKSVDKKFANSNLDRAGNAEVLEGKERELNTAIAIHLIREGHFDLYRTFCHECSLSLDSMLESQFSDMFSILDALKQRNLQPALSWCDSNKQALDNRSSDLYFQLHKLQFIMLLSGTPKTLDDINRQTIDALRYARSNFHAFGGRHLREIQRLMGSLAFVSSYPWYKLVKPSSATSSVPGYGSIEDALQSVLIDSPYVDVLSRNLWTEIESKFMKEACALLGLPQESPLRLVTDVGAQAIPAMIKIKSVLDERRKERPKIGIFNMDDELPVEIPLPRDQRFHSVFTCPVSREQTTSVNPPMMLQCGHVISKESLIRLSKGGKIGVTGGTGSNIGGSGPSTSLPGTAMDVEASDDGFSGVESAAPVEDPLAGIVPSAKIKCPYCPMESISGLARLVYF